MKTLTITKADLDKDNYYIGSTGVTDYEGHIEIESNLGTVKFKTELKASGNIVAQLGTGINAGEGINAGTGINAGWGINAGTGINAGWGINAKLTISAKLRIFAGLCLWRLPTDKETTITCSKLEGGIVAFGKLIETGETKSPDLLERVSDALKGNQDLINELAEALKP